jgi:hypothetical protein
MTLQLQHSRARLALPAVVAATLGLLGLALWSFATALIELGSALSLSAESIANGFSVPAAAVNGTSSGTLEVGRFEITHLYDGNGLPTEGAFVVAQQIRDFIVPYALANVLDATLVVSLAVVVLLLCVRLVRVQPFVAHVTWSLATFATLTAVFSITSQLVRAAPFAANNEPGFREHLATMMAAISAPPLPDITWDNDITYIPGTGAAPLDLTFVGMAVLLGLVAAAFAIGQRMQRDTEGLV